MLGAVLLVGSFLCGYVLVKRFAGIDRPVIILAGAFLAGTLMLGTAMYVFDLVGMAIWRIDWLSWVLVLLCMLVFLVLAQLRVRFLQSLATDLLRFKADPWAFWSGLAFLAFGLFLSYYTFTPLANGNFLVTNGSWSDIVYHHAYVRTVAFGANVPTQYPYFANTPIHYHFMFNYWAGKITQGGLPSLHVLNLLSAFSLAALLSLIVEFGRVYFGSTMVGILASVFLMFHSSLAAFTWIAQHLHFDDFWNQLFARTGWLSSQTFESWGLFNLNVFISRRNFAFALAVLLFVVLLVVLWRKNSTPTQRVPWQRGLLVAVLIGVLPFWNVVVALICVIFIGLFAFTTLKHKYLFRLLFLSALVAGLCILPQIWLFKSGETVLASYPRIHLGFGASDSGWLAYYWAVLGYKLPLIVLGILGLCMARRHLVILADAMIFALPFIVANVLQFGKILYDNNQFLILSLLFFNAYAAWVIWFLYKRLPVIIKSLSPIMVLAVTLAGAMDLIALVNHVKIELEDSTSFVRRWVERSTPKDAVFMTHGIMPFYDNPMVSINLAGRILYGLSSMVDSSCDVDQRLQMIGELYSASTLDLVYMNKLFQQEGIDYVLIDEHVRDSKHYQVNEDFYKSNYPLVYSSKGLAIYHVSPAK